MDSSILKELGLNPTQIKVYIAFIENGEMSPTAVSQVTKESRTNSYMVCKSLQDLGLISAVGEAKTKYQANNPIALEKLAERRRQDLADAETKVKRSMPVLLNYYYSFTEKPGIKMVQGAEGLKEIYNDTLRARKTIYHIRTPEEVRVLGDRFVQSYIKKRVENKIKIYSITPPPQKLSPKTKTDEELLFFRKLIPDGEYDAPVEFFAYGDRVAFLIYGEELMGLVIDSPALAKAIKQLFNIIRRRVE